MSITTSFAYITGPLPWTATWLVADWDPWVIHGGETPSSPAAVVASLVAYTGTDFYTGSCGYRLHRLHRPAL